MVCSKRRRTARRERGFSIGEMAVVLALIGLSTSAAVVAWQNYRRAAATTATVTTLRMKIQEARMLSVYRVLDHFVVIDPQARTLSVVEDTGTTAGVFDSADAVLSTTAWAPTVNMDLPVAPDPLPSPLGSGNLSAAWSLPLPDTSGAWGTNLRGLVFTPDGRIVSAAATPAVIGFGTIVFRDAWDDGQTLAVSIEGMSGTVRGFRLAGTQWEML